MKTILSNWNLMRALRFILGIIIVVQGVLVSEWMYAFAGILLTGMAIANIGGCGVGGCQVPFKKVDNSELQKEIEYDEIL